MVLFTHNVKKIKGAAHKKTDVNGTCKGGPKACSVTVTVALTDGTFVLFDGHCDGPILPVFTVAMTESLGVNEPLRLIH